MQITNTVQDEIEESIVSIIIKLEDCHDYNGLEEARRDLVTLMSDLEFKGIGWFGNSGAEVRHSDVQERVGAEE